MAISTETILKALDDIEAQVEDDPAFIGVEFFLEGRIAVYFSDWSGQRRLKQRSVSLVDGDSGETVEVPIGEELGAPIIPAVVALVEPVETLEEERDDNFIMGGDACHNVLEAYQGTIGFFAPQMEYVQSGKCNVTC